MSPVDKRGQILGIFRRYTSTDAGYVVRELPDGMISIEGKLPMSVAEADDFLFGAAKRERERFMAALGFRKRGGIGYADIGSPSA